MHLDADTYFNGDADAVNAIIYQRNADRSLAKVRTDFAQGQRDLLDALAPLTDADLLKAYSHYQPDEPGEDGGEPIVNWIVGNTYGHYAEHRAWIEALAP